MFLVCFLSKMNKIEMTLMRNVQLIYVITYIVFLDTAN